MQSRSLETFLVALYTSQKALPAIRNSENSPRERILTENALFTKPRIYTWKFLICPKVFDSSSRKYEVACSALSSGTDQSHFFLGREKGKLTRTHRHVMKRLGDNNNSNKTYVIALELESS